MCNDIIGNISCNFRSINCQSTFALCATSRSMRFILWIICQVPFQCYFAPITHSSDDHIFCVPQHVSLKLSLRACPLLSEIQIFCSLAVMNISHHACISGVHVEGSSINVFSSIRIFVDSQGIIRSIKIMVVDYNFCIDASSCKRWPQIILDEVSLLFSCHQHAWVISWMQGLVLRSNRSDSYSFSFHCLNIFDKIFSIRIIVLKFQTSSNTFIVILHPSGRTPGSSYDLDGGIYNQYSFQNGNQMSFIFIYTKLALVNVRLSIWEIIIAKDSRIKVRGSHAQPQIADSQLAISLTKQLIQQ